MSLERKSINKNNLIIELLQACSTEAMSELQPLGLVTKTKEKENRSGSKINLGWMSV